MQTRADIFPAKITIIDSEGKETYYEKVRIVVTLDHVYVFRDENPAPVVAFEDRLTSYTPPVPSTRVRKAHQLLDRSAKFETEDGYSGSFLRMSGCGCGSRMKNMSLSKLFPSNPLPQAVSTSDK